MDWTCAVASSCSASWHRGMRETDLIMGRFADAAIATLTDAELAEFERLIEVPDRELLAWVTGEARRAGRLRHARCFAGCAISTGVASGAR